MPLDLSRRKFIFASLALTAPLAACNTTAPASGEFSHSLTAPYRLDSGDRLRITVFDQPSLRIPTTSINPAMSPSRSSGRLLRAARRCRNLRLPSQRSCARAISAIRM